MVDLSSRMTLFNQTVVASLLQPLSDNQQSEAYRTKINLKITEQRNDHSGDKELKFEISRSDDFEFFYADVLNDFDAFPKTIIDHLLHRSHYNNESEMESKKLGEPISTTIREPVEIKITLNSEKTSCMFEMFRRNTLTDGKMFSLKLSAVRGDQLISQLLKICSVQAVKIANLRGIEEKLALMMSKCTEIEKENTRLTEIEKQMEACQTEREGLENDLEMVKEERENIRLLVEEKDELLADFQRNQEKYKSINEESEEELRVVGIMLEEEQAKVDGMTKNSAVQQKEIHRLRTENFTLIRNLAKLESLMKRNDERQGQQSVDLRKLKELETDLKQKDFMVTSLTETISLLRKELEDEKLKLGELGDSFDRMQNENEKMKEKLGLYRNQRLSTFSPAQISLGIPGNIGNTRNSYRKVLGPVASSNSPSGSHELDKGSPQQNPNRSHYPLTPYALRNSVKFLEELDKSELPLTRKIN
ncbi:unnamed protein product [Caenorhabditis sp. 36 PRJEB53466]|nr:unnamed protein product [Caenorhabditis sp. 36 PRJEB53466]